MLIARMDLPDGRKLLVLGLEEDNVRRIRNDEPIYKRLDGAGGEGDVVVPGLEDWDVSVLGPEDTARFVAHYAANPR